MNGITRRSLMGAASATGVALALTGGGQGPVSAAEVESSALSLEELLLQSEGLRATLAESYPPVVAAVEPGIAER